MLYPCLCPALLFTLLVTKLLLGHEPAVWSVERFPEGPRAQYLNTWDLGNINCSRALGEVDVN